MNLPVIPGEVERQQPEDMREYFRESLAFYQNVALKFPRCSDPVYQREQSNERKADVDLFMHTTNS